MLRRRDLGKLPYAEALDVQRRTHADLLASRGDESAPAGVLLLVEHDPPVITVSKRPAAREHLLASPAALARQGVELAETDRGGDITYHGPGQLIAYPIVDLNRLGLRLHGYMRALEDAVIATAASFGVAAHRDPDATGVWVTREAGAPGAKLCAMGIRVQRWVTMHGLALNVTTNLAHFALIVPCGLAGRPVTSLERLLAGAVPTMGDVKAQLAQSLDRALLAAAPDGRRVSRG